MIKILALLIILAAIVVVVGGFLAFAEIQKRARRPVSRQVQHPAAQLPYKKEDLTWLYANGLNPKDIEAAASLRNGLK